MDSASPSSIAANPSRVKSAADVEWLTMCLIFGCYGFWTTGGLLYVHMPFIAILSLTLSIAFHSSLQHEVLHGHPTRQPRVNEAMTFLPMNLFYPFRRYKDLHLRHHADHCLTDPYNDPESYYLSHAEWVRTPRWVKVVLSWNNTFVGRLAFGPAIALASFLSSEINTAARLRTGIFKDWVLHIIGATPMLFVVLVVFRMPLGAYLTATYLAASIISIRSFCEHRWSDSPASRSVIVESRFLRFIFLNNNLHLVHHSHPRAAWYDLPRLYEVRRTDWSRINDGYVFSSYADIVQRYGLRAKEPVVHPALRLVEDNAR